jgi:hypothetical protein
MTLSISMIDDHGCEQLESEVAEVPEIAEQVLCKRSGSNKSSTRKLSVR